MDFSWRRETLIIVTLWLCVFLAGCGTGKKSLSTVAPEPTPLPSEIEFTIGACPDFDASTLVQIRQHTSQLEAASTIIKAGRGPLNFGALKIDRANYAKFISRLNDSFKSGYSQKFFKNEAQCVAAVDKDKENPVLVSGYFTPVIEARRVKSARFSTPIYARPPNLLNLDLKLFGLDEKQNQRKAVIENGKIRPFYSRAEIYKNTLPLAQVIAFVDPIDAFHSQTQGSMLLRFADGSRLSLEYADKNGQPFRALGLELPITAPITWQKIEEFLRALPPAELESTLARNPSYVFFKSSKVIARTSSGAPAVANYTAAIDPKVYPLASLGILKFAGENQAQLIIAHDTGGAIKGARRLDWYLGVGDEAAHIAGEMRQWGQYFTIIPR